VSINPVIVPYANAKLSRTISANRDKDFLSMIEMRELELKAEPDASPWCMSSLKRFFDLACATPVLVLLSPGMLIVAVLIRLTSKGPILFRQQRVGLYRREFTIYKFRTMSHDIECVGPCVTKAGDLRLTGIGRFLRKYKLDEMPQLYNVLRGDMSLVGPRPKLPQHEHLEMHYRPGITGAATLAFANEESLLHEIPEGKLEDFHVNVVSPIKKLLDCQYHERATFLSDFCLLVSTLFKRSNCRDLRIISDLLRVGRANW